MSNSSHCPVDGLLQALFAKWAAHIIWVLGSKGPQRFGEMKRQLDTISTKILTERLRSLEAAGLINRDHVPTIPPQVTYSLTKRGGEIFNIVDELVVIANRWEAEDSSAKQYSAENKAEQQVMESDLSAPELS